MTTQTIDEAQQLEVIKPVFPAPTPAEIVSTLQAFGISHQQLVIEKTFTRMLTAGALISTEAGDFFLKRIHQRVIPGNELEKKHNAVNLIAQQLPRVCAEAGLDPVVTIPSYHCLPGSSGTVFSDGDWHYELVARVPGEDRYQANHSWQLPDSLEEAFSIGQALAAFHLAGEATWPQAPQVLEPGTYQIRFDLLPQLFEQQFFAQQFGAQDQRAVFPQGATQPRQSTRTYFPTALKAFLAERPLLEAWLTQQGYDVFQDFTAFCEVDLAGYEQLPRLWMHSDAYCNNMSFAGSQVLSIFDFGLAAPGTALADLATCLERNCIEWVEIVAGDPQRCSIDVAQAILNGYQSIRKLSEVEKRLLPEVLRVVQVESALNFIPSHLQADRPDSAEWSYEVFFKAHCQWFSTPPGIQFLAELRTHLGEASKRNSWVNQFSEAN